MGGILFIFFAKKATMNPYHAPTIGLSSPPIMRILFRFFLFWISVAYAWDWPLTESKQIGKKTLDDAFVKNAGSNFIAVINAPGFHEFPEVTKAVYYQHILGNGEKHLALELYRQNNLWMRFIQNADGAFAYSAPDDFAVRGGFFMRLYGITAIANPVYEKEMTYSNYTIDETTYAHKKCIKVTMKMPEEIKGQAPVLQGFTHVHLPSKYPLGSNQWGKDDDTSRINLFLKNRPCIREFIIDKETGILLTRKEYTTSKKCIASMSLGKFDLNPDWNEHSTIFDTPENIRCDVLNTQDFLDLLRLEDLRHSTLPLNDVSSGTTWTHTLYNGLLKYGQYFFLCLAAVAIAVRFIIQKQNYK